MWRLLHHNYYLLSSQMIFFLVWTEWQETFLVELIRYHKTVAKVTYQKIALEYSDTSAASYGIIWAPDPVHIVCHHMFSHPISSISYSERIWLIQLLNDQMDHYHCPCIPHYCINILHDIQNQVSLPLKWN